MAITPQKVLIRRTVNPNSQPTGLLPGELAVEMGNPCRLWVGVPTAQDPTGKKLLSPRGGVSIADVPPAFPIAGEMWWESDSGILWIWYVDVDTGQWVQAAGNIIGSGSGGGVPIDAYTKTEADAKFVKHAGDTMTGALSMSASAIYIDKLTAAGNNVIQGSSGGRARWAMVLGTGDAETGANVGSKFYITRYDDAGASLGTAMTIDRDTGVVNLFAPQIINGASTSVILQSTGQLSQIAHATLNVRRWSVGTSTDNNYRIIRHDAGGAVVDSTLALNQLTGDATFSNSVSGDILYARRTVVASGGNVSANALVGAGCAFNLQDETGNLKGAVGWDRAGNVSMINSVTGQALYLVAGVSMLSITGNAQKPGGGAWVDSSDARIKNVLGDYTSGLSAIMALQPVRYTFKGNDSAGEPSATPLGSREEREGTPTVPYPNSNHFLEASTAKEFIGLVAQDAETAMPELVTQSAGYIDGEAVTDLRTLDQTPLIFALINAVKELKAEVDALKAGR